MHLCSKPFNEWTDLSEIVGVLKKYGLTEAEAESTLNFLTKYFLELDESGRRARPIRSFYNLYENE